MQIIPMLLYILERKRLVELLLLIPLIVILVFIGIGHGPYLLSMVHVRPIQQIVLTFTILAVFIAILCRLYLFLMVQYGDSFDWFTWMGSNWFLEFVLLIIDVDFQVWLNEVLVLVPL